MGHRAATRRGGNGGVRQKLAAEVKGACDTLAGRPIQNGPRRLKRIKALHWQTTARGSFDLQRLSGALANPIRHLLRVASAVSAYRRHNKRTLTHLLEPSPSDDLLPSYSGDGSDICSR